LAEKKKAAVKTEEAKAATSKKTAVAEIAAEMKTATPIHAEVAQLAYQFWSERGRRHGSDWQDWLRAEQELRKGKSKTK
jgi:hypothetical protein